MNSAYNVDESVEYKVNFLAGARLHFSAVPLLLFSFCKQGGGEEIYIFRVAARLEVAEKCHSRID
jgi:hypothetical protein